jgi:hypothetical protein
MIFSSIKFLCLTALLSIGCFLARAAGPVAEPAAAVMKTPSGPNNSDAEEVSPAEEEDSSSDEGEEDPAAETSDENAEVDQETDQETDQEPNIDTQPSEETEEGQESILEDPSDLPGEPREENEGQLTEGPFYTVGAPLDTEVTPPSMAAGENLVEASFPESASAQVAPSVDASSMIAEPDSEFMSDDPEQGLEEGEDSGALEPEPFTSPPAPLNLSSPLPVTASAAAVESQTAPSFESTQATYEYGAQ